MQSRTDSLVDNPTPPSFSSLPVLCAAAQESLAHVLLQNTALENYLRTVLTISISVLKFIFKTHRSSFHQSAHKINPVVLF